MTFEEYLADNAGVVNDFLEGYFDRDVDPDIRRYLYDPLKEFTSNAGKRHRPLICMLACKAVGGDPMKALCSGAAIEHFHNAALIHDDIADESDLRRGEPCLYKKIGVGLAVNAGDMALSSVVSAVLEDDGLSDSMKLRVLDELVTMDIRTIEGQALDVGWAQDKRYDVDVEDYIQMATLKTAYYSGGVPLAVGAIIGEGTEEQVEALRQFGMKTGLAFQLQDDILNLVDVDGETKKDFRSDITEGKRTFAAVHALRNSDDSAELEQILDKKTKDPAELERAVQIMEEAGSIDKAREFAYDLTSDAKAILDRELEDSESKEILMSMADYFVERLR